MTLENTLLEKLSEWQPPAGRTELHTAADGWHVTVVSERCDELGCMVWELDLYRDGSEGVDLQKWAAAAERVTGLVQPLKVIEIDTGRNEAQLRSTSAVERGNNRYYHELLLGGVGRASLRRFQSTNGSTSREQVAFAMTHEALARLAADVAGAV